MEKIDLKGCKKVLEFDLLFLEGSAKGAVYKPPEEEFKGVYILAFHSDNAPQDFTDGVMRIISGSEGYIFKDKGVQ